jgi:hypothetical protein
MSSPFPGMDPYLEDTAFWVSFQHTLVALLREMLEPGLGERYQIIINERRYDAEGEQREEFLEVRRLSDGQVVTLLDVVSPANKTTAAGREAYLNTRRQSKAAGASLVEIDLVMHGQPMLDYSREGLPVWDHAVTVTRASQPERYEIYTATVQKKLPKFRLPLATDDRDTIIDLQSAFASTYDRANFDGRINYQEAPAVPLSDENRRWLDELLREKQLRGSSLPPALKETPGFIDSKTPHENVARAAYYLWQQEGCPHGRDKVHWYKAVEELRRQTDAG